MEYALPDLIISKELIDRIQFSVSSRNAEAKVSECAAHVFAAKYSDNPRDINWQYVTSGVACLLRSRELAKNGRKYMWTISLCIYNASYGVLVWKAKLLPNSDYTAVADNFHVFALGEVDVLIGLMFSSKERACELNTMYTKWHQERMRDDGKKGSFVSQNNSNGGAEAMRFRKDMISKPCNFQHIQGTQALDECMDIEKIKADIIAALFGLGTKAGRSEMDSEAQKVKSKKKKDVVKQKLEFKEIGLPQTQTNTSLPTSPGNSEYTPTIAEFSHNPDMVHQQVLSPLEIGTEFFNPEMANNFQGGRQLLPQTSSTSLGYGQSIGNEVNGYPGSGYQDRNEHMSSGSASFNYNPASDRDFSSGTPNYQNPASPAYQEYNSGQRTFAYSLEKEFAEPAMFKPSAVTAI